MADNKNRKAFWCECSSPDHLFVMEANQWEGDHSKELLIYYRLNHFRPFFNRVWIALKYIFKKESHIDYVEVMITNKETLKEMRDMIDDVINSETGKK